MIIENDQMKLVIAKDGTTKSLLFKPSNEECLIQYADARCLTIRSMALPGEAVKHGLLLQVQQRAVCRFLAHIRNKELKLLLSSNDFTLMETLGKEIKLNSAKECNYSLLPLGNKLYLKTNKLTKEKLIAAFQKAEILEL